MGKIVDKISHIFQEELNLCENDVAVVNYSLTIYSTTIVGYLAIIAVAWPLGVLKTALVSAITASLLRVFSGGAHAANPRNCILGGAVIFNVLGLLVKYLTPTSAVSVWLFSIGVLAFTSWSVYMYAPADTPGKPINTKKQRNRLRRYSFIFLVGWSGILFLTLLGVIHINTEFLNASALGTLWQGFSLIPSGYNLIHWIDEILEKV